jgi:hypothetical protein
MNNNIQLSLNQTLVLDLLKKGKNVVLAGTGNNGKTFVIDYAVNNKLMNLYRINVIYHHDISIPDGHIIEFIENNRPIKTLLKGSYQWIQHTNFVDEVKQLALNEKVAIITDGKLHNYDSYTYVVVFDN